VKDYLYWSDWEARSILQVDKLHATQDGYEVRNAVLHLYSPMDVRVYHQLKQPHAESELLAFFVEYYIQRFVSVGWAAGKASGL